MVVEIVVELSIIVVDVAVVVEPRSSNNLERSSTNFQFGSTDFTQHTENLNLVAELKTKISGNVNNQFNISYINVHEYRDFPGTLAPYIDIDNGRIKSTTIRRGSLKFDRIGAWSDQR